MQFYLKQWSIRLEVFFKNSVSHILQEAFRKNLKDAIYSIYKEKCVMHSILVQKLVKLKNYYNYQRVVCFLCTF